MKKLTVLALAGVFSATAFAAPVGETFTGFGAGVDLTSTKYKGGKQATSGAVFVDYGIDYGNNLVGVVEGKLKPHTSKAVEENIGNESYKVEEKGHLAVSYAQGYRVTPDLLPYVKVGYNITRYNKEYNEPGFSASESGAKSNIGYGAGVKYAVSSNFELGAEYTRSNMKFDERTKNANNFSATAGYRF